MNRREFLFFEGFVFVIELLVFLSVGFLFGDFVNEFGINRFESFVSVECFICLVKFRGVDCE